MSNKQHSDVHNNLMKKKSLEQAEVGEVMAVVKKYSTMIIGAVVLVLAVYIGITVVKNGKIKNRNNASVALADAGQLESMDPAQAAASYLDLVDEYKSSADAPVALLSAARLKFNAKAYDEAEVLYIQFLDEYSDHEAATLAELNIITCHEERGMVAEAAKQYADFASKGSYLAPAALMAQARCLESLGKDSEAKQIYEELSLSDSDWQMPAGNKL